METTAMILIHILESRINFKINTHMFTIVSTGRLSKFSSTFRRIIALNSRSVQAEHFVCKPPGLYAFDLLEV